MFKVVLLILLSFPVFSQTINLTTEHYPPYNIDLSLDGSGVGVGGASTEIVLEMMRRSGYSYSMNLMPWKRAYTSAQEKNYTGVFSTTRTEKREKLFQWVGPIADNNYVLFASKDSDININNDAELLKYSIGAYRGSVAVSLIEAKGVKPELVRRDHLNVLKLGRNRIDLWISGSLYGPYLAKQYGVNDLKEVYTVRKAKMYVAFNLDTPKPIINKLNAVLSKMREEGFLDNVYQKYR